MARKASIRRRTGWCTHQGVMLLEASRPSGMAVITASAVPQSAICNVMMISLRYSFHWEKSGGKKSAA